jgi:hypothetical protein
LARFVYLDESGVSNKKQEPWLVVAGVIVHGDHQLNKLYDEIEAVVKQHIPKDKQQEIVIHAADVYGGFGKHFDKRKNPEWKDAEKRHAILHDLAKIPKKVGLQVTTGWVERASFPKVATPQPEDLIEPRATLVAHVTAYISCLIEVDHWMRQNAKSENCLVIVEDNKDARALIRETHISHQSKALAAQLTPEQRQYFPFERIREDPAFQNKKPVHPLVLADFVAFVMKRFLMKDDWIKPFFAPWRKNLAALTVVPPSRLSDK